MTAGETFDYLAVLYSVVIGLALTELLQGFRRLLAARRRVVPYWPALLWSFTLILVLAQTWWAMFGLRVAGEWTFATYGVVLLHTVLLYLAAGLAMPELGGGERVDLRARYFANARPFFTLLVAFGLASFAKEAVLYERLPALADTVFQMIFVAGAAIAAVVPNERFHKIISVIFLVLFASYIAILFESSF
ncbi:hypothetical protein [Aurantiacibacter spongiae]|uniref:Uncharacterized protein n=1 Tax=Aurantiacibacter spongiae TaxID=2488860 RepID=A0A3N5CXV5_9SPHN|nr:hypothetical protein [Aurantiacibacter spongiae]RPF71479.1 hypothetical protein EG799_07510 [Aurantiacibacter spongiae]